MTQTVRYEENGWRKIATTRAMTRNIKGWRKWLAILLRCPTTYDVQMTASAWVKGPAVISIADNETVSITSGAGGGNTLVQLVQKETEEMK